MKKQLLSLFSLGICIMLQAQVSKTVKVTAAGTLITQLSATERSTVTNLAISGIIDARDFVILRDSMPKLNVIDLSEVIIDEYSGTGGTAGAISTNYWANSIPQYAFFNKTKDLGKSSLTTITIPSSVTSISNDAFYYCLGLKEVTIPKSVMSIGANAFKFCVKLTSITIPSSVTFIGNSAFMKCENLTSVTIPSSVNTIECFAFNGDDMLQSIYTYSTEPIDLTNILQVFDGINKTSCTLFVPLGSQEAYQTALQWKDFTSIKVMPETGISSMNEDKTLLFPNPTKQSFMINTEGVFKIEVYNVSGLLLNSRTVSGKEIISTNNLPSGMYVVKVFTFDKIIIKNLIIE